MTEVSIASVLRKSPADALAELDPFDPRLEGVLYAPQDIDVSDADVDAFLARNRYLQHGPDARHVARRAVTAGRLAIHGKTQLISGEPLATEAATPFALDGVTYPSLQVFYEALKFPDDERAGYLADPTIRLRRRRGRREGQFSYGGAAIEVGSLPHYQLIARAVSAKVEAHATVRAALVATGRARLKMGNAYSQPLGRIVPFAYMVERSRLG
ncbi:MAG: hypothetical protein H0X17_19130 [Deltaproteobacteria bacterium]|nr:hypothetical protein [Deltaproteobacteria bacterium]